MTGQLDLFRDCAAPPGQAIETDRDTPVPEEEPRRTQLTSLPGTTFEEIFSQIDFWPPDAA